MRFITMKKAYHLGTYFWKGQTNKQTNKSKYFEVGGRCFFFEFLLKLVMENN